MTLIVDETPREDASATPAAEYVGVPRKLRNASVSPMKGSK
jgi:hypothetical protein